MNSGSVVLEGPGDWGLTQLCAEWFGDQFVYKCDLSLATDEEDKKVYDLICKQGDTEYC